MMTNAMPTLNDEKMGMVWMTLIVGWIVLEIIQLFFCWSMVKTLKRIPEQKRTVPPFLSWFILVPLLGYVFMWIMIPFALPWSIKNAAIDSKVRSCGSTLFALGLIIMILPFFMWIPLLNALIILVSLVLWIIYWVKMVQVRHQFH